MAHDATAAGTSAEAEGSPRPRRALEELAWDESFVRELPADPRSDNTPRQVGWFYPTPCFLHVAPNTGTD
jgi:hypothetical protein